MRLQRRAVQIDEVSRRMHWVKARNRHYHAIIDGKKNLIEGLVPRAAVHPTKKEEGERDTW